MSKMRMLLLAGSLIAFGAMVGCAKEPEPQGTAPETTTSTTGDTTTGTTGETTTDGTTGEAPSEPAALTPDPDYKAPAVKDGEEVAVLDTDKGQIIVKFFPDKAPKHVERFKMLANKKFYDGTRFHRCIRNFMIQGGDPNSKDVAKAGMWGQGGYEENGKEKNVPHEFTSTKHVRGVLSAARQGAQNPEDDKKFFDTASSQFFLMHQDTDALDGKYSVYGQIVKGIEVVDEIVKTGSPDPYANGAVEPGDAVVLKTVRIVKWPVK